MITVEEATKMVLDHLIPLEEKTVPLNQAIGQVLREDLITDRPLPPYDRVTMDGIAILSSSFEQGNRSFPIEGVGAAGAPQAKLSDPAKCIEIMTGAILPEHTDAVIRYEDVEIENGIATIQVEVVKKMQNVHFQGQDRSPGELVVPGGKLLSSPEIGVAATVGKSMLKVAQLPKVIIISTGDELVEVDQRPLPHQIRKSNVHRIRATLRSWGLEADIAHLIDDEQVIHQRMEQILEEYQVIIMSGGVSKGKFDFIPRVLEQLNVKKLFHKIKQRPGKPFWFGQAPDGAIIFALPGNPVSSFMCTHLYFRPWMKACLGLEPFNYPYAILQQPVTFKPDLTYFLEVKLHHDSSGKLLATPVKGNGSGDLANLVDADGFMQLPRGKDLFEAGEVHPVLLYR